MLVNALYKAYTDVTGDTEHKPMVIGGGTYAKSLKNIIAFGPEKEGIDYRIHGANEFILVSGMEEAVLNFFLCLSQYFLYLRLPGRHLGIVFYDSAHKFPVDNICHRSHKEDTGYGSHVYDPAAGKADHCTDQIGKHPTSEVGFMRTVT